MKRTFRITLLLVFICNISLAQTNYALRQSVDFFRNHKLATGDWRNVLTESDIDGSPYLNDEFVEGSVFTTNKVKYEKIPLRYNVFSDALEFKTPEGQVQAMAAPETLEKAVFDGNEMIYISYVNVKKVRKGFFIVLEEGNTSLLRRSNIFFKEATEAAAYQEAQPAKFLKKPDTYYIRIGFTAAKKVSTKKELIAAFPDHKNEISTFIKKNKVKVSKPESLAKLVEYHNTL